MEDGRIAGPQLRMLRVALALSGRVDTIIAIPDRGPMDFRDALEKAKVPYVQVPLTKLSRSPSDIFLSLLRTPKEIFALRNAALSHGVDVVHSSGGAWMFKAIVASRLAGKPSIWHLNDTSSPAIFRVIARFLLRWWTSGVVVAGSRVKSHYLPDYNEVYSKRLRIKLIEAPVDTTKFIPKHTSSVKSTINIVTVGNVSPVKGYETLLHAARNVKTSSDYNWTVIGSSFNSQANYREKLDSTIARFQINTVKFTGPSANVAKDLASADIYVCTSVAEASPTAVWEAMACGLSIIATDVGSISDHITHGVNGFIVPVDDFNGIAKYLAILILDRDLRLDMGRRNRKIAQERFDISVCANRHFEIYAEVLG